MQQSNRLKAIVAALATFLVMTLAVATIIAVHAIGGIREIEEASKQLELRNFRIAGRMRSQIFQMSANSLRYQVTGEDSYRLRGETYRKELASYLVDTKPFFERPEEVTLFALLESRIEEYYRELEAIAASDSGEPRSLADQERAAESRDQAIELCHQLGIARRAIFQESLGTYQNAIQFLQYSLFVALAFLIVALGLLTWLAYRAFVRPLEEKLADVEEVVEQQQDLATLGTLAAGIAHEIRNPIAAMKARMFALAEFVKENSPASDLTSVIDRELDRLERIVSEFLNFARPAEPNREPTASAEFLDSFHELLHSELEMRGIRFTIGAKADAEVLIDRGQIQQVLENLVRNAADSCRNEPGHSISIASAIENSHLVIGVTDDGAGIANEHLPRVFEPFYSKKKGGTGLGLPISRNIARNHGGDVTFETSAGNGTSFHLALPLANPQNVGASH